MKELNKYDSNTISNLPEFLHLLASHHLQDLGDQCGLKLAGIDKDRSPIIKGILQHLEENPNEPLRLRGKGNTKLPSPEFQKGKNYVFGLATPYLNPVYSKKNGVQFELPDTSSLEILFFSPLRMGEERCIFGMLKMQFGLVVEGPWTIPTDTTVVTNLNYIRFEDKLIMAEGAKFYGQNPCGLHLEVNELQGTGYSEEQYPLISTSIRSIDQSTLTNEEIFEKIPVGIRDSEEVYLYQLKEGETLPTNTTGEDGQPGSNLESSYLYGANGNKGICNLGDEYVPPGDGKSIGNGVDGKEGGDGFSGYTPASLVIEIKGRIDSHLKFRFEAIGGSGGNGGSGGKGQNVYGGSGGNLSRICSWFDHRKPGLGGSAGNGGRGGLGGSAGSGGNGGTISLFYPADSTNEALFSANVKGGESGERGKGGHGGKSYKGGDGLWYDIFGNSEEPDRTSRSGYATHVLQYERDGGIGERGVSGKRGLNGSIRVNGEVVVSGGNRFELAKEYCYPNPGSGEC